MVETKLTISADERRYLVEVLQNLLKETRVEEHRTRTPSYRPSVIQKEDVIAGLLRKLESN